MNFNAPIYGACCAAYLVLVLLIFARGQVNRRAGLIAGASGVTALWAGGLAVSGFLPDAIEPLLNSLRLTGWLTLLVGLVGVPQRQQSGRSLLPVFVTVAFCAVMVGSDVGILIEDGTSAHPASRLNDLLHAGVGVAGLLAIENVLRNAEYVQRRNLSPLCLALGSIFAFELFMYADRLIAPGSAPVLPEGRGFISLVAVPLIAIAIARNREWRVDIHVSRQVVLHTAALVACGTFFLALSVVGVVLRSVGGAWGPVLQGLVLVGSALVLVCAMGATSLRSWSKKFIAQNFFTYRYDYRREWLRFVDTVSERATNEDGLSIRIIRALAQIVDSPAGVLWRIHGGNAYVPTTAWNLTVPLHKRLGKNAPFVAGFRGGEWIQVGAVGADSLEILDSPGPWGAIPLLHRECLLGFVALPIPKHAYPFDTETFDLLRAAGKQAASYLAEEQSTRSLVDTRALAELSKRFAFVAHDVKNLAAQLSLTLSNARTHLENPEFREDMLTTIEESVGKLNRLIGRLRGEMPDTGSAASEPDVVITRVAEEFSKIGMPVEVRLGAGGCAVPIEAEELRSALHHLINNAGEAASSTGGKVSPGIVVSSQIIGDTLTIEVIDDGPGMDEHFIREELFRPLRSTKDSGMGIGAYQTREIVRLAGGDLDVLSRKGLGTVMRISLPLCSQLPYASSAA